MNRIADSRGSSTGDLGEQAAPIAPARPRFSSISSQTTATAFTNR
jgi:hypothetical protein